MSDPPPPSSGGGAPRFRIVQGRGLGERAPAAPASTHNNEPRISLVQSTPLVQQMAPQHPQPMPVQAQPQPPSQPVQQQPPIQQAPPQQSMGSPMTPQGQQLTPGQAGGQQIDDQVVLKCVRFFKTLITLSQQPDQQQEGQSQRQTAARVNELVTNVIFGLMAAEDFTVSLQEALKSQAQPHLLPFLQKTLPHLREALRNGDVMIEGINPPPEFVMAPGAASGAAPPVAVSHQQPQPMASQPPQFVPASAPPPQAQMGVPSQPPIQHSQESRHQEMETDDSRPDEDVIQVRQLQESALKSALLRPEDIMKKITNRMNEACFVEEEVLTLISDAAEYRLREMLTELAVLADHRMDPIRLNPNYGAIDNTKAQIRFLEDLDRQQQEQSENRAKEELIRMSKGKGIGKETIEKAKEMQRADAEAKRNRDANAAAIAALSSKTSKTKWDGVTGGGGGGHITRPRTIRVNLRDLHVLANNDPLCARTQLLHKLALGGGVQADSI